MHQIIDIITVLNASLWSFEICNFQIESRKFESNRKSNPKPLNRIFYCQIESLIAVKSRFKSNRVSDLPTTGSWQRSVFEKSLRGHVQRVTGNVHVRFGFRSFNHFKLVWLTGALRTEIALWQMTSMSAYLLTFRTGKMDLLNKNRVCLFSYIFQ